MKFMNPAAMSEIWAVESVCKDAGEGERDLSRAWRVEVLGRSLR